MATNRYFETYTGIHTDDQWQTICQKSKARKDKWEREDAKESWCRGRGQNLQIIHRQFGGVLWRIRSRRWSAGSKLVPKLCKLISKDCEWVHLEWGWGVKWVMKNEQKTRSLSVGIACNWLHVRNQVVPANKQSLQSTRLHWKVKKKMHQEQQSASKLSSSRKGSPWARK